MSASKDNVDKTLTENRSKLQSPPSSDEKIKCDKKLNLSQMEPFTFSLPSQARYRPATDSALDDANKDKNILYFRACTLKENASINPYNIPFGFTHNDLSSLYVPTVKK